MKTSTVILYLATALYLASATSGEDQTRDLNAQETADDNGKSEFVGGDADSARKHELSKLADLNQKVWQLWRQGKSREAIRFAEKAVDIATRLHGETHKETAKCICNLAAQYKAIRKYDLAAQLFEQATRILKTTLGEKHPHYVTSLTDLAAVNTLMGDYERAEEQYNEVLKLSRQSFGEKHWKSITAMWKLAGVQKLSKLNDSERAELSGASRLNQQVVQLFNVGKSKEALDLAEHAVKIAARLLGDNHPTTADYMFNQSAQFQAMGRYDRAAKLCRQASEIQKTTLGEKHPRYALSLRRLASIYYSQGDYAKSEKLRNQALSVLKESYRDNYIDYAITLDGLGSLYTATGDFTRAEASFRQAIKIFRETTGEKNRLYAQSINNLARLFVHTGNYAAAEPLAHKALAIRKEILRSDHPDFADSFSNLGNLHLSTGGFEQAREYFQRALAIARVSDNRATYAVHLNNLAVLYHSMGNYEEALRLLEQSLEVFKTALGKEHGQYAASLFNVAHQFHSMGEYDKAAELYLQALASIRAAHGEKHLRYGRFLITLAELYRAQGDYTNAEREILTSLKVIRESLGESNPDYARSLTNHAVILNSMRQFARAEPKFQQALRITRDHLDATALVLDEQQQLAHRRSVRYRLDNFLWCVMNLEGRESIGFSAALQFKGATLVRQHALRSAARQTTMKKRIEELQNVTRQWSALVNSVPQPQQAELFRQKVENLRGEKDRLEQELMHRSSRYREATRVATPETIAAVLPADTILIDYLIIGQAKKRKQHRTLIAFVLGADGDTQLFNLGPLEPIVEDIHLWRMSFGGRTNAIEAAERLRKRLWEPVVESIGAAKTVLVSPDGVLGTFPFGALPGRKPGTYLIEDHRLAVVPVARLIATTSNEPMEQQAQNDLLVMGDIDYDRAVHKANTSPSHQLVTRSRHTRFLTDGMKWHSLPGAATESNVVKRQFQSRLGASVGSIFDIRGDMATEAGFRRHAPHCQHIHLATHGFFAAADETSAEYGDNLEEVPSGPFTQSMVRGYSPGLLSGLVFAGANNPIQLPDDATQDVDVPDDGILTAEEIRSLFLDNVELVVLSACETGLGEVAAGEGLLGIQRAFQIAGAKSTIATLWKVDDQTTMQVMERFYGNLARAGTSPLDALRNAQVWALNHPKEISRTTGDRGLEQVGRLNEQDQISAVRADRLPPRYWAAFTFSGDWR